MRTIESIINEVIKEEARQEAILIMQKANAKELEEFYKYYNNDSFNVVCMVIEKVKYDLVKKGLMKYKKDDQFGKTDIWE